MQQQQPTMCGNVRAILLKNIAVMQKQKPTMCAQFFIGFKNSPPAGILYQERSNESSLSETSSSQKFQSSQILCDPALLNINLKRCESCRQRRQQYLSCVFFKLVHCKSGRGKSIYKLCRVWVWVWCGCKNSLLSAGISACYHPFPTPPPFLICL